MLTDLDLTNFTSGEISPRMRGRVDVTKYWNGCESMLNMVVQPQGGATNRPGTRYVNTVNTQATPPRLIDFVFSTTQAYVLEIDGTGSAWIYRNDGVITSGGSPVQLALPYLSNDITYGTMNDLPAISWCQSNDTLYLFHPYYPTQQITRSSDTVWNVAPVVFRDGPYLPVNTGATTLTLSAYAGPGASVTVVASSLVGINAIPGNNGQGFLSGDVGRLLRIQGQNLWAWLLITAVTSSAQVTATVQATNPNGAFGGIDGQPWQPSTLYPDQAIVAANGNYYVCQSAGISASSGSGPSGTSPGQIDGGATWNIWGGNPWSANTAYSLGYVIYNAGRYYRCTYAGTSASTGSGPSGPGSVGDNSVTWTAFTQAPLLVSGNWALGKWSATTGYPWCGAFWQQRLLCGATNNQPLALEGSVTADVLNFAPTQGNGTVNANNALSWILDDVQQNGINWLSIAGSAQAMQLAIGTRGSEHILQAATTSAALTPTSVQAYIETAYGTAQNVKPLRIGKSLLFFNRPGKKLHEWTFQWQVNGYIGPDISVLSEHLLRAGATRAVWQQNPLGIVWMIVGGGLVGMTYLREQDVVAFHRHQLGGAYNGGPPLIDDLCVIPSADGTYDELWLAVCRTVNGVTLRTIEVLTPFFDGPLLDACWFLDCALQTVPTEMDASVTGTGFTAVTQTDGRTLYTGAGTMSYGVSAVMPVASVGQVLRVNGGIGVVTALGTNAGGVHQLTVQVLQPMLALTAPANTWSLTTPFTSVSGLSYLNGSPVTLVADNVVWTGSTVANGSIPVPNPGCTLATVGLPYTSALVTMPLEPAARQGAAQGKVKQLGKMFLRLDSAAITGFGASAGARVIDPDYDTVKDNLDPITYTQTEYNGVNLTGFSATYCAALQQPLFAGVRRLDVTASADFEGRMIVQMTNPYPITVLAIGVRVDLEDQ